MYEWVEGRLGKMDRSSTCIYALEVCFCTSPSVLSVTSCLRIGVMWERLTVLVNKRAAEFRSFRRRFNSNLGRPKYIELQKSIFKLINA